MQLTQIIVTKKKEKTATIPHSHTIINANYANDLRFELRKDNFRMSMK